LIWHGWDQFVEHAALPEQRVSADFRRVGLEQSIHTEAFAGGAEHCEQHHLSKAPAIYRGKKFCLTS
jgi:hypothetical protein